MHKLGEEQCIALKDKSKSGKRLVLASESPRRQDLLRYLGVDFETMPSYIEETFEAGKSPAEVAMQLSVQKAMAVKEKIISEYPTERRGYELERLVIIAADTIVVSGSTFLAKPSSKKDAYDMLLMLSGKVHEVYTGIAVISFAAQGHDLIVTTDFEKSLVFMRKLASVEIEAYIATGEPMDKAGGYAVQGTGGALIERVEGCISNVIGLPMTKTVNLLRQAGIKVLGC
jgi:septum formation protein